MRRAEVSLEPVGMGTLYYGDILNILRRYLDDESADLMAPRLVEFRRLGEQL